MKQTCIFMSIASISAEHPLHIMWFECLFVLENLHHSFTLHFTLPYLTILYIIVLHYIRNSYNPVITFHLYFTSRN